VRDADRRRGVSLGVAVDHQHGSATLRERRGNVDARRGLADTALLVGDGDHSRAGGEGKVRLLEFSKHTLVREHVAREGAVIIGEDTGKGVMARAVRAGAGTVVVHSFSLARRRGRG